MISEILTGILVVITAIYAYLTYRMARASEASVREVQAQSESLLRPYVTVTPFVRQNTVCLYLRISNQGRTAARNLRLSMDRDFFQFGEENPVGNLRTANAFSMPIDSFPPGSELIFGLGQGWVLFGNESKEDKTPVQFCVEATYEFGTKTVSEKNHIDLRPYNRTEPEKNPILGELERIRKVMEKAK